MDYLNSSILVQYAVHGLKNELNLIFGDLNKRTLVKGLVVVVEN
jgi:hypothetical protein